MSSLARVDDAKTYLHQHNVKAAITSAVARAIRERPSDPVWAIGQWLATHQSTPAMPACVISPCTTTLAALLQETADGTMARRLQKLGIESSRHASFATAAQRLRDAGIQRDATTAAFWVPGRIEVLGKHTDYAGGRSLLCAVNRGFSVVCTERPDAVCRIFASFELEGGHDVVEIPISAERTAPLPSSWATYPAVTARRLARNFGIAGGVDIAFDCDLPEASGMSSSSAVIILTFLALAARNQLASKPQFQRLLPTPELLCHYLGCIENGQDCGAELPGDTGVGTFGGSEDHTAILLCSAGELQQYSFCPTALEARVPMPRSLCFVIAVSGATARKGAEKLADYNNAVLLAGWAAAAAAEAQAAVEAQAATPTDAANAKGCTRVESSHSKVEGKRRPTLASITAEAASQLGLPPSDEMVRRTAMDQISLADKGSHPSGCSEGALRRRYEQFHHESEVIIPAVSAALARHRQIPAEALHAVLSAQVGRSHALSSTHLRNTLAETDWLPAAAQRLGAIAASAFGAGFGGSVWALVRCEEARAFCEAWEQEYASIFPERRVNARFFTMPMPAPGACSVVDGA